MSGERYRELRAMLDERGYRQRVTREPGWFDHVIPGRGFVRFTINDDGTTTATRLDYDGFRMTPVTPFPAEVPVADIIRTLTKMEQMADQARSPSAES